jgi:thymidylate synthase
VTHVIRAQNVRQAYSEGMLYVRTHGREETTRNGPALVVPWPVVTVYERPDQRVLLDLARDANPFFHALEAFWMLAGRRDVESLMRYNAGMRKYSDDGEVFHGAYGHRWRHHFGQDQLATIIRLLRENPNDRRIVLQMWDPSADLGRSGLDFPCNNLCYFRQAAPGVLDMTIACRSNDALFGAYGANAVHFSVLHEFVASMVGMELGSMHQISNNLHIYLETADRAGEPLPYHGYPEATAPLFGDLSKASVTGVLRDIEDLWSDTCYLPRYLPANTHNLVSGMRTAWDGWKTKSMSRFFEGTGMIQAAGHEDWWNACVEWGHRRAEKFS